MRSSVARWAWWMGLTLVLGALLPLGCGVEEPAFTGAHFTPTPPDPRWLPRRVVADLTACARHLQVPPPSAEEHPDLFVDFDAQVGRSGEVDRVTLRRSTMGDHGVQACMAGALEGMTLPLRDLVQQAAKKGTMPLSPEARGLVGNAALLMPIALLPAVLMVARTAIVVTVVAFVAYAVVEAILDYATATTTTAAPTATTTATAAPTATATATAPPMPPGFRRGECLPCLPVPVGGFGYDYHSAAAGNSPHNGMANHTHHFRMNQSPPAKGCRCFWDRKFMHPTSGFSPLPGAVLVTGSAEGGGVAP